MATTDFGTVAKNDRTFALESFFRNATEDEVSIIGLDLAKNVFQAHGARTDGYGRLLCCGSRHRHFGTAMPAGGEP